MTRDDIIKLAREAGIIEECKHDTPEFVAELLNCLERFAALVAAAERHACAKVCEDIADTNKWSDAITAAQAIRARSQV